MVVSYADRAPDESLSTPPSVNKSIWLKLDPATLQFGEILQSFEGEADSAAMTLDMKTWVWVRAYTTTGARSPAASRRIHLDLSSGRNVCRDHGLQSRQRPLRGERS